MSRREKIRKNERFRRKYEKLFYDRIYKALVSQVKAFTSDIKTSGFAVAQSRMQTTLINANIGPVIQSLYLVAGKAKAGEVYQRLRKESRQQKNMGFNATWTQQILDYFGLFLMDKVVVPITATTRKMIEDKIAVMIQEGRSIEWLVQQVETSQFLAWRARMIARTESNRAINFGANMGAQQTGFATWKEWVAVHDNRTRHSHLELDTQKIDMNQEFLPGLAYPGDPNGAPDQTINCRCHLEYSIKRDANGKPIMGAGRTYTVSRRQSRTAQRLINMLNNQ